MFKKIVIFGVGLIGGSVALAMKKQPQPPLILGVGRQPASLQQALQLGLIDRAETNIEQALEGADLILIATPVAQTPHILRAIRPYLTPEMVVTDAGSTKSDVMTVAEAELGQQVQQFVGGHPIAGAEKSGPTAALSGLYHGKNVILTPNQSTSADALQRVTALWQQCGAVVSQMTPTAHDAVFAAVSHLPHMLAFILVDDLAKRDNAELLFNFAASGFRDFTRIAGSHPEMWRDIALANQQALLDELKRYQTAVHALTDLLAAGNGNALLNLFTHASEARNAWGEAHAQRKQQ